MYEKFYVHEKNLRTRNCRRRFIKNLLPEKRNENMETKQPRFESQLNYINIFEKSCVGESIDWTKIV